MKQKMKKVVAAVLAAVMVLAMSVTAFAEPATGEEDPVIPDAIVIKVPTNSNQVLDGRTFKAYKIFDVKVDKDGNNFSYTLPKEGVGTGKELEGVKKAIKAAGGNITTLKEATDWLDKATTDNMKKFVNALDFSKFKPEGTYAMENSSKGKITGLSDGYYVVTEDPLTSGEDTAVGLAMLDTVYSKGAVVELKAEVPTVDKTVNNKKEVPSEIGSTVNYKITTTLPKDEIINGYDKYQFIVNDTLSKGLKLTGSVDVQWADATGTALGAVANNTVLNPTVPTGEDATTITIAIGSQYKDKDKNTKYDVKDLLKGKPEGAKGFVITYKAEVTEDADIVGAGNANTVDVTYSNNPKTDSTANTTDKKVKVFSYTLDIVKKNEKGTKLNGAKFKLYSDSDAKNEIPVVAAKDGVAGHYVVAGATDEDDKYTTTGVEMETPEGDQLGMINIIGLKAGKTYYLKETKAPDGYNELKEVITFTINDDKLDGNVDNDANPSLTISGTTDATSNETTITVVNHTGNELPSTGGVGTTILYVVGILAMAAAVFYFVMNKRSKEVK